MKIVMIVVQMGDFKCAKAGKVTLKWSHSFSVPATAGLKVTIYASGIKYASENTESWAAAA